MNEGHKKRLLDRLSAIHKKNESWDSFCSHPDSVVTLTVRPEDEDKIYRPQYKIASALEPAVHEIIDRWLKTGKIKLAPRTGFNSPLLAVPKKDDKGKMTGVRLCLDIRALNQHLVEKDNFQLPRINDMLAAFGGNALFGEYDLSEAYFQFRLSEESQRYTAFTWDGKQYVFVGCPFGIKHIPSLFQRFIANLFHDMPFVFAYIDNIAFASKDWEEHYEHARMIVERLNSVRLRIKPSSYNLGNTRINLLGHRISAKGIELDPEKVEMIEKWELPQTGERLQSALGLGAYLRDNIRHYADIAAPLEAVKKEKEIPWDDKLKRHWQLWKRAFASAPIISFPDFNKRFVLATDASQTGIGGILYQPDDDSDTITKDNIIAITSKQLNGSQRNYPVYKKELWAVVYCLRKFHSFLWGRKNVTVLTDHKPLIHILQQRQMTVALQQWIDVILDYDLSIKYRPGILHVIPDALSRMYEATYLDPTITWGTQSNITFLQKYDHAHASPSDILCTQSLTAIKPLSGVKKRHKIANTECRGGKRSKTDARASTDSYDVGEVDDNDVDNETDPAVRTVQSSDNTFNALAPVNTADFEPLPDELEMEFEVALSAGALLEAGDANNDAVARVRALTTSDAGTMEVDDIVAWMAHGDSDSTPAPCIRALTAEQKLLLAQEDRGKTVPPPETQKKLLERAHAGHFGETAMYQQIYHQGWWWPHMRTDIKNLVENCTDCRKFTVFKHGFHPAQSITASQPGDHYQVDLAEMKETTEGHTYCLVLVDVCTGFVMLRPILVKTAETTAHALWDIFTTIGVPKVLQSDNGSEFLNETIRALTKKLGVPHRFISEYNPRADGKVERTVRTVKDTVMKLLEGASVFWHLHIPFVQYAYNTKVQRLTGSTPFALMYGRAPNAPNSYEAIPETEWEPINIAEWRRKQDDVLSLVFPSVAKRVGEEQQKYMSYLDAKRKLIIKDFLKAGTKIEVKDPKYILAPRPGVEPTYVGPYFVVRQNKYGAYIVKDQHGNILDRTIPLDQIKTRYHPSPLTKTPPVSPLDAVNDAIASDAQSKEYDVERILDHMKDEEDGLIKYLVQWKGHTEQTWEPASHFNDRAIIEKYWRSEEMKKKLRSYAHMRRIVSAGSFTIDSSRHL